MQKLSKDYLISGNFSLSPPPSLSLSLSHKHPHKHTLLAENRTLCLRGLYHEIFVLWFVISYRNIKHVRPGCRTFRQDCTYILGSKDILFRRAYFSEVLPFEKQIKAQKQYTQQHMILDHKLHPARWIGLTSWLWISLSGTLPLTGLDQLKLVSWSGPCSSQRAIFSSSCVGGDLWGHSTLLLSSLILQVAVSFLLACTANLRSLVLVEASTGTSTSSLVLTGCTVPWDDLFSPAFTTVISVAVIPPHPKVIKNPYARDSQRRPV